MTGTELSGFAENGLLHAVDIADQAERQFWQCCELGIYVENRLADPFDPTSISENDLLRLRVRALAEDERLTELTHNTFLTPFWIRYGDCTAGIVSLSSCASALRPSVQVWSLYLLPQYRGQGLGRAVLGALFDIAIAKGYAGVRVGTEWTYQHAVRFYLHLGFWVTGWKRNLDFAHCDHLPEYRCDITWDVARFAILLKEKKHTEILYTAWRRDLFLDLHIEPPAQHLYAEGSVLPHYAMSTFALFLAFKGWPLIRNLKDWERRYWYSDGGMPEGLAYKIEIFEALARRRGFVVATPKIPGLAYRDWSAIMEEKPQGVGAEDLGHST
jgi:GNAT superfamily N-acetyltransferase